MARPSLNVSKVAAILMDSHFFPDVEVAKTHGISIASLKRYRKRVETDPDLARALAQLKDQTLKPVEPKIKDAIASSLKWLQETQEMLPRDLVSMIEVRENLLAFHRIQLETTFVSAKLDSIRERFPDKFKAIANEMETLGLGFEPNPPIAD